MSSEFKKGFTLIELLVVIAVIGILSGMIVVSMNGVTRQASVAKAQVYSNSLRNSLLLNFVGDITLDGTYNDTWNNNTGTAGGTPTAYSGTSCVQNSCYSFNGGVGGSSSTNYITLPDISNYTMGTQMTAMIWIKGNSQTGKVPFAHWDDAGASTLRGEWQIMGGANGTMRVIVSNDGTINSLVKDYITTVSTPFDGTWHLVGFTFAPGATTGTLTLYVDGVAVAVTASVDANVPSIYNSTSVLSLACSVTNGACTAGTYFAGLLDDARLYNATIPLSQIKEMYYAGLTKLFNSGKISFEEYSDRTANN